MKSKVSTLVVFEDDPIIQWQLRRQLNKMNVGKAHFYDKKSDLAKAFEINNNKTLLINLKLADGWIAEGILQSLQSHFEKIIVLTGYRNNSFVASTLIHKSISFLFKPYSEYQLKTLISNINSED
tara:strand:+ start:2247 stop:2621 length:375 start_codon:yes stop_codon:yes gene_type:complete